MANNKENQANTFRPQTLRADLGDLKVNEQLVLPAEKLHSAKTTASDLGFILNRKYRVQRNSADRTVVVTRIN